MDEDIKIGDVVVLKSGGPAMTTFFKYQDKFECMWFNESGKLEKSYFLDKTLKKN